MTDQQAIQRESRQPRFEDMPQNAESGISYSMNWLYKPHLIEPPYSPTDTRKYDNWLIDFAASEPNLTNILSSVISKDKNRAWELTGGSRQVKLYGDLLRSVENGAGWRHFVSLQSRAYYTTTVGAITEVERWTDDEDSYMRSLYHVDPTRARLTGNPAYPLKYYPKKGRMQNWQPHDFFRTVSNPDVREDWRGLGQPAVARCLSLTKMLIAVYEHDLEQLGAEIPQGFVLFKGFTRRDFDEAKRARNEQRANGEDFIDVLTLFSNSGTANIDAQFMPYSRLPVDFNLESFVKLVVMGYALAFGYDAAEFYPIQSGTFGRGTEALIQAEKTTYKGEADFSLEFQNHIQNNLPPTLDYSFDRNDDAGDMRKAEKHGAELDNINKMYAQPGGLQSLITVDEARHLIAERGIIPGEWTEDNEGFITSDTERQRRALRDNEAVVRAAERFPDDSIVTLRYDPKTLRSKLRTHWATGDDFRQSLRVYPGVSLAQLPQQRQPTHKRISDLILRSMIDHDDNCTCGHCAAGHDTNARIVRNPNALKGRGVYRDAQPGAALYEDDDVKITTGDVDLAIVEAADRVGQEFADLLTAETWQPEQRSRVAIFRAYYWDKTAQRYRDDSGKFVSAEQVRQWVRLSIESNRDFAGTIAEQVSTGGVNTTEARALIREELKREYIRQATAGRGGRSEMTQSDWGRVGAMLKNQYQYLDGFMSDIDNMNLTEGQIRARLNMYFESSSQAYETFNAIAHGIDPTLLPHYPGDGSTICMTNCKCYWDLKPRYTSGVLIGYDCFWTRTIEESCPDCIARASEYNPLEIRFSI